MTQTTVAATQPVRNIVTTATATAPDARLEPAPTIAVRKSCNPDGIGLSHYVLMDQKAAK